MGSDGALLRSSEDRTNGSFTPFIRGSLSPYLVRSTGRAVLPRQSAAFLLAFPRASARLYVQVRCDRGRCYHRRAAQRSTL